MLASKLSLPLPQAAAVRREHLLERLAGSGAPVTTIMAPAGYGKTTLLGQWAARVPAVAFVRLDRGDDDPTVLLSYLVAALDRVEPLPDEFRALLSAPGHSLEATVLPRFIEMLWAMRTPAVLILDDVQAITGRAALDVIAWLLAHQPPNLRLAIGGRSTPDLPLARLRLEGRLLELGPADLAMDDADIAAMAAARGLRLDAQQATDLQVATEGWPAAVYLALRRMSERPGGDPGFDVRGDQASLGDYMRDELLAPLDPPMQAWLCRASVLDVLDGPLCDAALETSGSLALLRQLERSNLFLVPLDETRTAYRFHHLFSEFLRDELESRDPVAAREIRRRAANWCAAHGQPEQGTEYAHEAGDLEAVAAMAARYSLPMFWRGRSATCERWIAWFDEDGLRDRWATVAVMAGWLNATQGRLERAEHWLAAAERAPDTGPMPDGTPDKGPWVALLRAGLARDGVSAMAADVRAADARLAADSPFRPVLMHVTSAAAVMAGDLAAAREAADVDVALCDSMAAASAATQALGSRASIAMRLGDHALARDDVSRGMRIIESEHLADYVNSAIVFAVGARLAIASGAPSEGRSLLRAFDRLRPTLTAALPWVAADARLHALRACVTLGDTAAARTLLLELGSILRIRPRLGTYATEAAELRETIEHMRAGGAAAGTLTSAEIRVLGYLPSHLSFRDIAERLHVSPHTIKSQAISIYGKLGASSRHDAIQSAVEAGLLDPAVLRFPDLRDVQRQVASPTL